MASMHGSNDLAPIISGTHAPAIDSSRSDQATLASTPISTDQQAGLVSSLIDDIDGLLTSGQIDQTSAVLIITALSRDRSLRQNEAINLYLEGHTKIPEILAQISARNELGIEQPERQEFLALGELLFVLAIADHDPALLARIEFGQQQGDRMSQLESDLRSFAERKLVEVLSPIARLCARHAWHANSAYEQAILEGALRPIFERVLDQPESVVERIGSLFSRRRPGKAESQHGLFDQDMSDQQRILLNRLIKISEHGEPARARIWRTYLQQQAVEQEREEQRRNREERERELENPDKIAARLNFILANFTAQTRLRELEAFLYLDVAITQRQYHDIINSLPLGLNYGSAGGFKGMREELQARHLGEFEARSFEPADRYVAWLALHRIGVVDNPDELSQSQAKLFRILERGCDWPTLSPEYQAALKYLFHELLSELQSGDPSALPQIKN